MEKLNRLTLDRLAPALPEVALLRPEGELSGADLRAVAQFCFRSAQEGRVQVVLDLEGVGHLDYRGVSSLRAARQLLLRAGGDLKLAGASNYLQAILRAAGAHGELDLFATAEEAQLAFAES